MSELDETSATKILRLIDQLAISMERGFIDLKRELRIDLRREIDSVRGELGSVRDELKGEIGSVRGELKGEIGSLRYDMNKRFDRVDERFDQLDARVTRLERSKRKRGDS